MADFNAVTDLHHAYSRALTFFNKFGEDFMQVFEYAEMGMLMKSEASWPYATKCMCCKNDTSSIIGRDPNIYICRSCYHVFRDYSFIDLKEFYNEYFRSKHTTNTKKISKDSEKMQKDLRMVNIIKPWIKSTHTLFELGSSFGNLASLLKNNTEMKDFFCCEIDDKMAKECQNKGHKVVNEDFFKIKNQQYDCFLGIDVIEHILHLPELVDKIRELGFKRVVTQVPVNREIHNRLPWDGHFHYFNKKSLIELFGSEYKLVFSYDTKKGETQAGEGLITVFDKI